MTRVHATALFSETTLRSIFGSSTSLCTNHTFHITATTNCLPTEMVMNVVYVLLLTMQFTTLSTYQ